MMGYCLGPMNGGINGRLITSSPQVTPIQVSVGIYLVVLYR